MKDMLLTTIGLETVEDGEITPMVEVTRGYDLRGSSAMFHLVNTTGHFGRSFFKPVEVSNIPLKIRLEKEPSHLRSLVTGEEIPFRWEDGCVHLTIERLDEFEAVYVTY